MDLLSRDHKVTEGSLEAMGSVKAVAVRYAALCVGYPPFLSGLPPQHKQHHSVLKLLGNSPSFLFLGLFIFFSHILHFFYYVYFRPTSYQFWSQGLCAYFTALQR